MNRILAVFILCFFNFLSSQDREAFDKIYVKTYLETSQKDFQHALKIADSLYVSSIDPLYKTKSLMLSATLYQQNGDFTHSVDYALKAEGIISDTDNAVWKSRVYGFLATQYRMLKLYDSSLKFTNKALQESQEIENEKAANTVKGMMMQEKAYYEIDQKNYSQSIKYIKKAQKFLASVQSNADFFSANNDQVLGLNYYFLKNYNASLLHYKKALAYFDKNNENHLIVLIYTGLANVYIELGQLEKAKYNLDLAEKKASNTEYLLVKNEIYEAAQKYYLAKKDVEKVKEIKGKQDSITDKIDSQAGSYLNKSFSVIQEKSNNTEKSNFWKNIILTISTLIIVSGLIFFSYYRKEQKKTLIRFRKIISEVNKRAQNKPMATGNKSIEILKTETSEENSIMTLLTEEKIVAKLEEFESGLLFIKNDISLPSLASYCKTNTKYLSHIINKYKEMDFNNYINQLRINYIIEKLKNNPEYRKYKIATLSEEAGFSSQNKFATIFKKVTSISPSTFVKFLHDEKNLRF